MNVFFFFNFTKNMFISVIECMAVVTFVTRRSLYGDAHFFQLVTSSYPKDTDVSRPFLTTTRCVLAWKAAGHTVQRGSWGDDAANVSPKDHQRTGAPRRLSLFTITPLLPSVCLPAMERPGAREICHCTRSELGTLPSSHARRTSCHTQPSPETFCRDSA